MSPDIRELSDLLSRERAAALAADLDALETLQIEKRVLLDRGIDTNDRAYPSLMRVARANVGLIRQLAALHRALAGIDTSPSYGSDGREHDSIPPPSFTRAVL